MVAETELYDALGIASTATESEIKSAYRKMALKYHPDKNGGSESAAEKFKEVAEAYEILSDPAKRKLYDAHGKAGATGGAGGPSQGPGGFNAEDIFAAFFGGGGQRSRPGQRKARDVVLEVEVTLEEVYHGTSKVLQVKRQRKCTTCEGTGSADKKPTRCVGCNGSGIRMQTMMLGAMQMQQQVRCGACGGAGSMRPVRPCNRCEARGYCNEAKSFRVQIPRSVEDGDSQRINGEGDQSPDTDVDGDILIVFEVLAHPVFHRLGNDLVLRCRVPLFRLMDPTLIIPVEHLDGRVLQCRLSRGEGEESCVWCPNFAYECSREGLFLKDSLNERGSLRLMIIPVMPTSLTAVQQESILLALRGREQSAIKTDASSTTTTPSLSSSSQTVYHVMDWVPPVKSTPTPKTSQKKGSTDSKRSSSSSQSQSSGPKVHVQQCPQQ